MQYFHGPPRGHGPQVGNHWSSVYVYGYPPMAFKSRTHHGLHGNKKKNFKVVVVFFCYHGDHGVWALIFFFFLFFVWALIFEPLWCHTLCYKAPVDTVGTHFYSLDLTQSDLLVKVPAEKHFSAGLSFTCCPDYHPSLEEPPFASLFSG